ncbi:MAG TPA: hypothetical protein VGM29_09110 [Polyangiaceae bacterium]
MSVDRSVLRYGAFLLFACSLLLPSAASAQFPGGPGGGMGGGMMPMGGGMGQGPPPGGKKKKKDEPPPGTPETHAASGADDSLEAPGSEPSLPDQPLKMKKSARAAIGTDADPDEEELGRDAHSKYHFYGPYFSERSGKYQLQLAFPVWAERTMPSRTKPQEVDRASLFGGLYYNRRSAEHADDILFPVFWNLRDKTKDSRTTIVGPLVNRSAPGETDNWLAPLYFTGTRKDGGYTLIPPLLTYTHKDAEGGFNLVGPLFCSWSGGDSCDTRTAQNIDFGVAPLYFYGQNLKTKYEVIPPLLHYYRYNDRDLSWTDLWGPYFRRHTQKREMFHLFPLYYSIWGQDERHTTVLPFFHYGYHGDSWLFANPLFVMARGDHDERTFVTWLYARYRGRTELDMITPLYWAYRDPDIGLDEKILFPFLYSRTSPRENNQLFFPFWGHFERYGISETTWLTPFYRHSTDLRGWETDINPIVFIGRNARDAHTVIAPFLWDFASPSSRSTVAFPVFWRFSTERELTQLVGNVYYHEKKLKSGLDWEFHVFPLFSYGESPTGHFWNVLYGLAGYSRDGKTTKMRTLWIPIKLSGD